MALTDENGSGMVMPVAPIYGSSNSGFGNGFGGDGWWIILLFILLAGNNGWGNGFGGNAGSFAADGAMLYPWMNQAEITTSGFQNSILNDNITSIRDGVQGLSTQLCDGFGNVQQSLCNGFAGVNATINSGFANAETAANTRQMANMQQAFANQTAMAQEFNQLGTQFADCCCENRLASADLKYTIATENCADRAALSDGIRDLLTNQTANTQRILDQLCQDKIDAKNEKIADLERQLTMANLAASQTAQTSRLLADNAAQTTALEQYLNPVPVPAYVVQNPNCCTSGCTSGCGCSSF